MRHFKTGYVLEAHDFAGKEVEAVMDAVFVAGREEKLKTEADAEDSPWRTGARLYTIP
jgi:hypothetical protein